MSRVVTISLSPQGRAYTRALKNEKSLSPPILVGGEAVDTNDWCIMHPTIKFDPSECNMVPVIIKLI